jgi:hypothetical protein
MSPTRNTPSSGHPVNNVNAGESSEDNVMEESLGCFKSLRDTQPIDPPGGSEAGMPTGVLPCNQEIGLDARSCGSIS